MQFNTICIICCIITIRSSDIRAHARNNFNQLQYLKELIPQLNQFQVPALHINNARTQTKLEKIAFGIG